MLTLPVQRRDFCKMEFQMFYWGTMQLHSCRGSGSSPPTHPAPPPSTTVMTVLLAAVSPRWDAHMEHRNGTSQRSSERFWIASATTVRRREMTARGSSLPITALPDTIMLAPAWCKEKKQKIKLCGKKRKITESDLNFWNCLTEMRVCISYLCTLVNGVRTNTSIHFNV